jgi:glycosyltransferase involved in cell wall biosynthesis
MENVSPYVSVVMSVYNGSFFLKEAVISILDQSFKNFEFIIINDGSTDNSLNILNEFKDDRIRIIDNGVNKGLIYSLNIGLKEAHGEYIVRMDADDISLPDRIEKQINFMQKHPDIGISGGYIERFGNNVENKILKYSTNIEINKVQLLFSPCVAHPSVIIRKSIIDNYNLHYESTYKNAEDYAFWVNAIAFTKISNIPEILLRYRVVSSSVTQQANKDFNRRFSILSLIYSNYFKRLNHIHDSDELLLHFIIADNERFINYGKNIAPPIIKKYLKKIFIIGKKSKQFDDDYLALFINKRGASISRWYTKNKFDFLYYAMKFLYYRIKLMFK